MPTRHSSFGIAVIYLNLVLALAAQVRVPLIHQFRGGPVPAGAEVRLEFDRDEYLIGESAEFRFILENQGRQAFEAWFGGDYRGSPRAIRFKITAVNSSGEEAPDSHPNPRFGGGIHHSVTVHAGDSHITTLELGRYRRILTPGTYTIRATHDFGWVDTPGTHPVGETRIHFRLPSPEEAERLVAGLQARADASQQNPESRRAATAQFARLRSPAYLDSLTRLARTGNRDALHGIGGIASVDATRALIDFATGNDFELALEAASILTNRLPDSDYPQKRYPQIRKNLLPPQERLLLITPAWDPTLTSKVHDLAVSLLARDMTNAVSIGAYLFHSIGTPDDASYLLDALERAIESTTTPRRDTTNPLDLPAPILDLLRAFDSLTHRGLVLSHPPRTDAEILVYFDRVRHDESHRPPDWQASSLKHAQHDKFPIRIAVARSIPSPCPPDLFDLVEWLLRDPDPGVRLAGCRIARNSNHPGFQPSLVNLVTHDENDSVVREAGAAAQELGGSFELLVAWAGRLAEERHTFDAYTELGQVIVGLTGDGGGQNNLTPLERHQLSERWRSFLHQNEDTIRAGIKFERDNPAVTRDLFSRARYWRLPDGSNWPPQD